MHQKIPKHVGRRTVYHEQYGVVSTPQVAAVLRLSTPWPLNDATSAAGCRAARWRHIELVKANSSTSVYRVLFLSNPTPNHVRIRQLIRWKGGIILPETDKSI